MINAKTWNPAQIDQAIRRLEGIIRSGSYNPAELNQLLNQLGEPGYINTWNPAELDQKLRTLLHDLLTWKTVTGNPIQLRTNNGGLVQSCEVTFSPIQSGSGDPSPENVRPISGWDSLVLTRTGKNLFDKTAKDTTKGYVSGVYLNDLGSYITPSTQGLIWYVSEYLKANPNTEYKIYGLSTISSGAPCLCFYNSNKTFISAVQYSNTATKIFTTPANTAYIRISVGPNANQEDNITLLETGKIQTHTATLPDTVYGGSHEFVSGKLTSEWGYIAEYDGETITEPWISSIDVYAPGTTPSTGAEVCYKLATPTEITLTPEEIELLTGENVLWTDGDSIEIIYKKLLLPSDVESLSKIKKIEEKQKTTKRSKKKKEE